MQKTKLQVQFEKLLIRIIRNELLLAIAVVLLLAVVAIGFGWENNKLIPTNAVSTSHYLGEPQNHLSFMANWDGRDYIAIAQHGYQNEVQTNLFPVYPLIVRLVTYVVRSPLCSCLLVTWASFIGAVYFYLKIFKRLYNLKDNLEALRGVLFFVLFPTGVFLLAAYTESLFAFVALGAIYCALQKRYLPAALCTLLATATHENGLFVLAFVALLLLEQEEKWQKIIAGAVIGALGLLSYMTFLLFRFHNALAFVASQKTNGWLDYSHSRLLTELATRKLLFLILIIISVIYWWNRRRTFAIYSLMYVAIVFLGGLGGFGRYALMAFPAQIMLYEYFRKKKLGYTIALVFLGMFWMYFALQFAGGYSGG